MKRVVVFKGLLILQLCIMSLSLFGCVNSNPQNEVGDEISPAPGGVWSTPEAVRVRFVDLWFGEPTGNPSISKESDGWYLKVVALEDDSSGFFAMGDVLTVILYREELLLQVRELVPDDEMELYYFYVGKSEWDYDLYCVEVVLFDNRE